mgnify:CR=1 FL=1
MKKDTKENQANCLRYHAQAYEASNKVNANICPNKEEDDSRQRLKLPC